MQSDRRRAIASSLVMVLLAVLPALPSWAEGSKEVTLTVSGWV